MNNTSRSMLALLLWGMYFLLLSLVPTAAQDPPAPPPPAAVLNPKGEPIPGARVQKTHAILATGMERYDAVFSADGYITLTVRCTASIGSCLAFSRTEAVGDRTVIGVWQYSAGIGATTLRAHQESYVFKPDKPRTHVTVYDASGACKVSVRPALPPM